jgi:hypothetical protein
MNLTEHGRMAEEYQTQGGELSRKLEIVTVLTRRVDYDRLVELGGPRPDQISMALRHYLRLMNGTLKDQQTGGVRGVTDLVTTFQCAISKELCNQVRNLGGRLDFHMMEAVRLFLL